MQGCLVVCHLISDDTANLHVCGVIICVSKSNKIWLQIQNHYKICWNFRNWSILHLKIRAVYNDSAKSDMIYKN